MWNPFSDAAQGAVKGFGEAIKDAVGAFKADPTKVVELESTLEKARLDLEGKIEEAGAKALESVNATMREEAKSEHWMQWSWRPFVGYTFSLVIINNYILYPYFGKFGMLKADIPGDLWSAMLVVLGVAAATRGAVQWQKAKGET